MFQRRSIGPVSRRIYSVIEVLEDRRLLSAGPTPPAGGGQPQDGPPPPSITFSLAPIAVKNGLDALAVVDHVSAPAANQPVFLGNANGIETYTFDIKSASSDTKLTVDPMGHVVVPPKHTTATFGAINNAAVTNEIKAIASALKLTAPTASTSVDVTMPPNRPAIYAITLSPANANASTNAKPKGVEICVDANGLPVGAPPLPLSVLPAVIRNALVANTPTGAPALPANAPIDVQTIDGVPLYTAHFNGKNGKTTVTVDAHGKLTSLPSSMTVAFSTLPTAAKTELQALANASGFAGAIPATTKVQKFMEANGNVVFSIKLSVTKTDSAGKSHTQQITLSVDGNGNPTVPPAPPAQPQGPAAGPASQGAAPGGAGGQGGPAGQGGGPGGGGGSDNT